MRVVSLLHRWAGGLIGLLLALIGLTGAILVWEGQWVALPGAGDRVIEDVGRLAAITDAASAGGELSRITYASDEIGLHQLVYKDGSGAYVSQDGTVVERWVSQWERPELWLFDFHHHLFAGEAGETVTGIAGIAGLLFLFTGAILWWRSRRSFRPRLLPRQMKPGPIVSHHRDLGAIALPLLLVSMVTGVLMLFQPVRVALLGEEVRPKFERAHAGPASAARALVLAKREFPNAELRRITLPATPGDPIYVRLRQESEWTPNGRTQVILSPDGSLAVEDATAANRSASLAEKAYPIHSAKVGGMLWKLALSASGFALFLLGSLAVWSFWVRRQTKRTKLMRIRSAPAQGPLRSGSG